MTLTTAQAGVVRAILDSLIPQTARDQGVTNWPDYLAYIDRRATRHLKHRGIKKRQRRHPMPLFDDQGDLILRVPLDDRGERFAIIYPSDWIALQEDECDGLWCCDDDGSGCLRVKTWRTMAGNRALNHVIVARHILDLGQNARMRYRNGDRLDLRRSNLDHTGGNTSPDARPAKYRATQAVQVGARRRDMVAA